MKKGGFFFKQNVFISILKKKGFSSCNWEHLSVACTYHENDSFVVLLLVSKNKKNV